MNKTLKIVYAEDNELVREMTARVLKNIAFPGSHLEEKTSGETLVDYVRQNPVDLIITDGHMGALSGIDALRQLRSEGYNIPALLLTGTPQDAFPDGIPYGFDSDDKAKIPGIPQAYILVKPAPLALIRKTLDTLLSESQI